MEIATEGDDRRSQRQPLPEWVIEVNEKLRNMEPPPEPEEESRGEEKKCIHRVLAHYYRDDDVCDVYRPKVVSFGPYHHGSESCRLSEVHKSDALVHFLRRSEKPLQLYYEAVLGVVEGLKYNYDQLDRVWRGDNKDFSKMMILDGCFLLEILRGVKNKLSYYALDNPVLSIHEDPILREHYRHDMLLLENQLPMLLLKTLLDVETQGNNNNSVDTDHQQVLNLKNCMASMFSLSLESITSSDFMWKKHILDVYREKFVDQEATRPSKIGSKDLNIPSATELGKIGIEFTTSHTTTSLGNISFHGKTFNVPKIVVDRATKSKILNIIALEKCFIFGKEVTSYIYLMGHLIQNDNDVSFLQSYGIINGALPTGEVTRLFYRLSKDILLAPDDYSLTEECLDVGSKLRKHFDKMSRGWMKDLFLNYLRTPWAIISVIAATLLLSLTMIQTLFTVLSYVNRK